MNDRERFDAIMDYGSFDRVPCWYFGTWKETRERWRAEGWPEGQPVEKAAGLDPDWEDGMWNVHGLADNKPSPTGRESRVIEETADYRVVEHGDGSVVKESLAGSSIPQTIRHQLEPTRESWEVFKKRLDPSKPGRRPVAWREKARELEKRERMTCFLGGSLYGWPRAWMGMENVSVPMYDDPTLFEEIVAHIADFFIEVNGPVLDEVGFEFAYFFEDCCFKNGPMFSPEVYRKHLHPHYRRMVDFYRSKGVKHMLVDSDGKVDALVGCWLESGIDILFPIEVGTWKADPVEFRREYGRDLRMVGGVDKHVIPKGESAIREHLAPLAELATEGGFVPLPDHRIPPHASLDQFRTYVRVFREMFGEEAVAAAREKR